MALNDAAVSILQLQFPAAALTMTPSAGHCVSRISSATRHPLPASVRCSAAPVMARGVGCGCGTPHLALVTRIRLGSCTGGAHTSSGIAHCSAPMQRAVGARRASAGGCAHSVRSFPLSVSLGPHRTVVS